jgi:signal transduction histidine kinase
MEKANILIVDDEVGPRESLKMILKPHFNIFTATKGAEALEILDQVPIDLVTVDLKMPGLPGTKVLEKVKQHDPDIEAIIITGYGSMDTAIEGLRLGAFDYIAKPFDVNHILTLIRRAIERRNARVKLKQIRSDFLANVSHELRTPLSVVIGFVSLLLDRLVGRLTEEQERALERVYSNSAELLELIDNVLCLTSLNSGHLNIVEEELDVTTMLNETMRRYEKLLEEKNIDLAIQSPKTGVRIVSDPAKLGRIIQNLLHNAIKFTPKGRITVKLDRSVNPERVHLEIVDTGVGIPPDRMDAMFHPFHTFDTLPGRTSSGMGLGLTVASRLTDFLGGTLKINSQVSVGTAVHLSIPYRLAAHGEGVFNHRF